MTDYKTVTEEPVVSEDRPVDARIPSPSEMDRVWRDREEEQAQYDTLLDVCTNAIRLSHRSQAVEGLRVTTQYPERVALMVVRNLRNSGWNVGLDVGAIFRTILIKYPTK